MITLVLLYKLNFTHFLQADEQIRDKETNADKDSKEEKEAESSMAEKLKHFANGFHFGSYGRVVIGGDTTGRPIQDAEIVARGTRMDEATYAELELRREDHWEATNAYTCVVATIAFAHPVFHYNADFSARLAIRNLFVEERGLGLKNLSIWAGSRMYRGDDIYVLDFWPLDNLNTLGGGMRYRWPTKTDLRLHAGINQPNHPLFLRPPASDENGEPVGPFLNRQKLITSFRLSHEFALRNSTNIKFVGYGEFHWVPQAEHALGEEMSKEKFPSDHGFVLGSELSVFWGKRSSHINLYGRYAQGLAAFGEWGPTNIASLNDAFKAKGAVEWLVASGGNYEIGPFALLYGAYFRSLRNANQVLDPEDRLEGILLLRPQVWLTKKRWLGLAVEASYQAQQRAQVSEQENGQNSLLRGSLGRFGAMAFLSPAGQGSYARPHLRLMYMFTIRDDGARQMYAPSSIFHQRKQDHLIALGVEWWFGSSSYFRN